MIVRKQAAVVSRHICINNYDRFLYEFKELIATYAKDDQRDQIKIATEPVVAYSFDGPKGSIMVRYCKNISTGETGICFAITHEGEQYRFYTFELKLMPYALHMSGPNGISMYMLDEKSYVIAFLHQLITMLSYYTLPACKQCANAYTPTWIELWLGGTYKRAIGASFIFQ